MDFECATKDRSVGLQAAHNDPNVQAAAQAFLHAPVRSMVKVLRISLYNFLPSYRHRPVILDNKVESAHQPFAYEMIAATNAIYELDDGTDEAREARAYARGAVIEKIAEALLREREPKLLTEQCIGPLEGSWFKDGKSNPIDYFFPEPPHEFWDAKSDTRRVDGDLLNAFNLLLGMAGPSAMAGFITLWEREIVVDHLAPFTNFDQPLYAYCFENFEQMSYGRPLTRVDPNA